MSAQGSHQFALELPGWANSPAWAFFVISSEPRLLAGDDGIGEVHHAPLAVGQAAVVEHLQEDVVDVGVGLSISSSRITLYGRRRTRSVSWPPSS